MTQLPLPSFGELPNVTTQEELEKTYQTDGVTSSEARVSLELKYADVLVTTKEFNRKLVSYQANKTARFHSWLKYKEGFSAELVEVLLDKFHVGPGQTVLDPFAGSGTTLLVAQGKGIDAVGIDILPVCHVVWQAKAHYRHYDLTTLRQIRDWIRSNQPESMIPFPHIPITESAFPQRQERVLMGYVDYLKGLAVDEPTKNLLRLALMSILEDISYTRKDGQYLRWDTRSLKAQERDNKRITAGKDPYRPFHKGDLSDVAQALQAALSRVIEDIQSVQSRNSLESEQTLIEGTVLEVLPQARANQFAAVITSPPYCNRYDYTRTYALELAFLGLSHDDIVRLRQEQLSCTVENRSKLRQLEQFYGSIDRLADYQKVVEAITSNAALQEVFLAIETRAARGYLNNEGVVQMVKGYFTELAFVIYELRRVCQPGAHVAIVNDNVRYGGEIIPVDLLMTDLAVSFGFEPETIYVLEQRKGNSSQQMGKFGREALRKSIMVWRKPLTN